MVAPIALLSIATASPPHILRPTDVARAAGVLFGERFAAFDRMAKVFQAAGIDQRQSVRPIEWFFSLLNLAMMGVRITEETAASGAYSFGHLKSLRAETGGVGS